MNIKDCYDPEIMDRGIRRGFWIYRESKCVIDEKKIKIIELYLKEKKSYREIQSELKVSPNIIKKTIVLAMRTYPFLKKYAITRK
jgi:predicted RNA-binding protein YlxR (DUF448 family)